MRGPIILLALLTAACCTPSQTGDPSSTASANLAPPLQPLENTATPQQIAQGRIIVERACASCHEVEPGAPSPHPDAPNLANLSEEYPVALLDEAFAEGIMVGHPDMPEFKLQPDQVKALIGYLESIQAKRGI